MFIWPLANQCWTWVLFVLLLHLKCTAVKWYASLFSHSKSPLDWIYRLLCKLLQKGKPCYGISEARVKSWQKDASVQLIGFLNVSTFHSGETTQNGQLPVASIGLKGPKLGSLFLQECGMVLGRQGARPHLWVMGIRDERSDFTAQLHVHILLYPVIWLDRHLQKDFIRRSFCRGSMWKMPNTCRCIAAVLIVT